VGKLHGIIDSTHHLVSDPGEHSWLTIVVVDMTTGSRVNTWHVLCTGQQFLHVFTHSLPIIKCLHYNNLPFSDGELRCKAAKLAKATC
jgi:hypothetical protein